MRFSVGPRIARLHVGGGRRAGFSSGLGPLSVYGGGSRRRSYGNSRRKQGGWGSDEHFEATVGRPATNQETFWFLGLTVLVFAAAFVGGTTHPVLGWLFFVGMMVWWIKFAAKRRAKLSRLKHANDRGSSN